MPDNELYLPKEDPLDGDVVMFQRNQDYPARNYQYVVDAQGLADWIGNLHQAYAGISSINGVAQGLTPTVPAQLINFTANMPAALNATPNFAGNTVSVGVDGDYLVRANVSLIGPPAAVYLVDLYQNGVYINERTIIAIDAAGANNAGSVEAMVPAVVGDAFTVWITALGAVVTVTMSTAQLTVHKMGNQPPP
jgi:hypothetical protein